MPRNVTRKLIDDHLVSGDAEPGREIGLRIDQTLTQDATGTLVMLEFEALNLPRVRTQVSAQYVDHNLLQTDFKNPDDHLFLRSAARKFGVHYSRPGNGVSHPVHMERFGLPGTTLVGSDSHTPAAGSLGMLAIGAGGLEVALAMAGEPLYLKMPEVLGVRLEGQLPDWVSAKDVVLEMLRRYDVDGAKGMVIEYYGPGLAHLDAMDRHVIANMGTEMGATSTVFPADEAVRAFLAGQDRAGDDRELTADEGAAFDHHDEIDLSALEPLIALPSSPGKVVPVREVAGEPLYQTYLGSSANPGFRDFAVPAMMVDGRRTDPGVSFDVNPTSRQILANLAEHGYLAKLVHAGARLHQAGCNGCIGMGQAPATGHNSLRTVPRNFPGRSGTQEDRVFLCSPETATASALRGVITDPRDLDMPYPAYRPPERFTLDTEMIEAPAPPEEARGLEVVKGPNIQPLPEFEGLPDTLELEVALAVGDDVSTDEIMPAGAEVLPFRSNVPEISRFVYRAVDPTFPDRAAELRDRDGGSIIVGGQNYGQGSSREHAAIAPRYLGVRVVIAESFARIHWQNLANFGVLALTFDAPDDRDRLEAGTRLRLEGLHDALEHGTPIEARIVGEDRPVTLTHQLSERQVAMLRAGSLIADLRARLEN
ncbi:MAG: aconitate hydratase [Trueperaceae bacterium]|nr:aconitate hydratase [Trueperaceae bacterium]